MVQPDFSGESMTDANDNVKIDPTGPLKRPRGRPKGSTPALSGAQREKARSERLKAAGVGFLKVELSHDLLDALDRFAASKDRARVESKSQVVERVLRAYLMRKR